MSFTLDKWGLHRRDWESAFPKSKGWEGRSAGITLRMVGARGENLALEIRALGVRSRGRVGAKGWVDPVVSQL